MKLIATILQAMRIACSDDNRAEASSSLQARGTGMTSLKTIWLQGGQEKVLAGAGVAVEVEGKGTRYMYGKDHVMNESLDFLCSHAIPLITPCVASAFRLLPPNQCIPLPFSHDHNPF